MRFYQRLNDKIFLLEKHIKERKDKEQSGPLSFLYAPDVKLPHSFSLLDSWEHLKLSFYKLLLVLAQIALVIKGTPSSNFNVFTKAGRDGIYICNYSYCHYKGYHTNTKWRSLSMVIAATIIISLAVALVFPGKPRAMAAIYSFLQNNWSGGESALTTAHATDQAGWTKYAIGASLSIIGSISDIKLNLTNAAATPWLQTNWITGADIVSTAAHAIDRTSWTKFFSKEDQYISADTAGELKLASIPGVYTETSDTDFDEANLVGGWSMDERNGIYINDSSGNGNTGTLNYGSSLRFSGAQYVLVNSAPVVSSSNHSLEVWVRTTSSAGDKPIAGKLQSCCSSNYYMRTAAGGKASYYVNGVTPNVITSNSIINDGKWHQIVGTFNGTTLNIYVDGVIDATPVSVTGTPESNSYPFYIGRNSGSYFTGSIDEVRAYNKVLSSTEVSEHYNGIFTDETELKGKWTLNEGTGQNVSDTSGNSKNGTLGFDANAGADDPAWQTDSVATWTTGKYGNALKFDGVDDYVTAQDSNSLDITSVFTFSSWVYLTKSSWPLNEEWATIFTKDNPWGAYWFAIKNDGKIQTFFNGGANQFLSTGAISSNAWQHVAVTYDGSTIRNYINGTLSGETGWVGSVSANTQNLIFGTTSGNQYHFAGSIDEVRIYNTSLTQAQIQAVMANSKGKGNTYVTGSGASGGVKLIIPPAQVTGLAAASSNAQVVLTWSAPANNGGSIAGYRVHRSTTSGAETLLVSGGCSGLGNVLTCTDAGLTNGTTYYYKVSAVNAIGEGSQSSEVNATAGYISGVCSGIKVYYTDVSGTKNWTDAGTACASTGDRRPTRSELSCMYTNKASLGSFVSNYYWTSEAFGGGNSWARHFGTGTETTGADSNPWYVRCVR